MSIVAMIIFFVKPLREKVLRIKQRDDEYNKKIQAIKNLAMAQALNEMTKIYYEAMETGELKKYKYESFCYQYQLYKELGGNHWSIKMMSDMENVKVIGN